MSFHTWAHSPGVFVPGEMAMLQSLIEEMRGESWYPRTNPMQEKLAACVLNTYDRGVTCPARIKAICEIAARQFLDAPNA